MLPPKSSANGLLMSAYFNGLALESGSTWILSPLDYETELYSVLPRGRIVLRKTILPRDKRFIIPSQTSGACSLLALATSELTPCPHPSDSAPLSVRESVVEMSIPSEQCVRGCQIRGIGSHDAHLIHYFFETLNGDWLGYAPKLCLT